MFWCWGPVQHFFSKQFPRSFSTWKFSVLTFWSWGAGLSASAKLCPWRAKILYITASKWHRESMFPIRNHGLINECDGRLGLPLCFTRKPFDFIGELKIHGWTIPLQGPHPAYARLNVNFGTWTHLPLNKMATIIADNIFKYIFLNEIVRISLKFVPKGPIDNKSALVQVMAWRRTGDKPLPEPMLTQFTDAYMRH